MLRGSTETPTIEIKAAGPWSAPLLAKDILAMSNVRDGGHIIIGLEDGTFERQGLTPEQRATYDINRMRDQMAKFADPKVVFVVEFPKDVAGKEYAVIRVLPFDEVPVICAVDAADLLKGRLYYRNTNGKVESAPVSNAHDMRDIITTAAQRLMRRLSAAGFTVTTEPDSAEEKRARESLKKERGGL